MHAFRLRPRISVLVPVLWVAALVAMHFCGTNAFAASSSRPHLAHRTSLAGTWSGQYSGSVSGTFTISWTQSGSSLSGSIILSSPSGKYGISGSVHGGAISFGAVGAGATYSGSVSGKSMSGSWAAPIGGGAWSAHKTS